MIVSHRECLALAAGALPPGGGRGPRASLIVRNDLGLYGVASPLGPTDVASRFVAERLPRDLELSCGDSEKQDGLVKALRKINSEWLEVVAANREYLGLGCSFVAMLAHAETVTVVNVGSGRAHQIRNFQIVERTADQAFEFEVYRRGRPDTGRAYPHAIGMPEPELDVVSWRAAPGDLFVLTEKVHETLSDDQILSLLRRSDRLETMADNLVRASVQCDARDATSANVVRWAARSG
jgi:serine/threonine protein phosphatase PrpC